MITTTTTILNEKNFPINPVAKDSLVLKTK